MCSMGGIVLEQFGAGEVGGAALMRLKSVALVALSNVNQTTAPPSAPARSNKRGK